MAMKADNKLITGDEVEFHEGAKIVLPKGMTYGKAYRVLQRLEQEAETPTDFSHRFKYRPDDGAYATVQVIKAKYGMLLGHVIDMGWFGKINAQTRTINIGVNQTMQVPWGVIEIPTMPDLGLQLAASSDKDYGAIFEIRGTGPRKYREEVEDFFDAVETYLREHSIYRGHAIIGADDPQFLDMSAFDASKIVYSDEVQAALDGTLWAPIKYTDAMRRERVSLKRAMLLHGPYGAGKTSVGQITAQIAVANGWTFISARPGRDKVEDVLRTARLYQPAVVFVEDIDAEASKGEADDVTKLMEAFDGITSKGGELLVVMTTNHIEKIHKGMLRPGRLDAVVEVAALDRNGVERLIKATIPENRRAENIDFDRVHEAMEGFLPAFIAESLTRAVTFSINRLEGAQHYVLDTDDLYHAALSLRPQLAILNGAGEGDKRPVLDVALQESVIAAVQQMNVRVAPGYDYQPIKSLHQLDAEGFSNTDTD